MSQQSTQNLRRRVRLAVVASGSGALGAVWLIASATESVAARPAFVTPTAAMLADIPSHDRAYRASLIPSPGPIGWDRPLAWTVEIRTAAGAPVTGAALALESWMPDDERPSAERPRETAELGAGRYRIEGLRFDRRGWWNVRLRVSDAGVTDSLAFNLVL